MRDQHRRVIHEKHRTAQAERERVRPAPSRGRARCVTRAAAGHGDHRDRRAWSSRWRSAGYVAWRRRATARRRRCWPRRSPSPKRRSSRRRRRRRAARRRCSQPGTFRTERERLEAALPRAAARRRRVSRHRRRHHRALPPRRRRWPSSDASPKRSSATRKSIQKAGGNDIYRCTARLGVGEAQLAQGKDDAAVTIFQELCDRHELAAAGRRRADAARSRRADGGKKDEATRAFTRVVDEFPQSLYATEAKEQLAGIKKA